MKTCKKHIAEPVFVYRECAGCELQALRDERDKARSEADSLRKDAERLRWLRQHEFDIGSYHGVHEHNAAAWFEHIDDESIDRCIAEEAAFAEASTAQGANP